jgi:hypothetical protein
VAVVIGTISKGILCGGRCQRRPCLSSLRWVPQGEQPKWD